MFSMFSSEKWVTLYRAQLLLANGENPENWGYSCLFMDEKFDRLLRKKYAEINSITGSHFHVFSFTEPPRVLINSRISILNQLFSDGKISGLIYKELKESLEGLKENRKDQDMDYERQKIRQELQEANGLSNLQASNIDIVLFDLKRIKSNSREIPAIILNAAFKEDETDLMLKFIIEISDYARNLYVSGVDNKDEKFMKYLENKCNTCINVKIVRDLLRTVLNLKDAIFA